MEPRASGNLKRRRTQAGLFHKGPRNRPHNDAGAIEDAGAGVDDFFFGNEPEPAAAAAAGGREQQPEPRAGRRKRQRDAVAPFKPVPEAAAGADVEERHDDRDDEEMIAAGAGPQVAVPPAGPDHGGAAAAGPGGAAAPAAAAGVARVARVDVPDGFRLFGDVPANVRRDANTDEYFIPLVLEHWASRHVIAGVAVTDLLKLFHGVFGARLGVRSEHLERGGVIKETARSMFEISYDLIEALGLERLLVPGEVDIPPEEDNLKAKGASHAVPYWFAPDLALNIVLKLMDPLLNSPEAPMFFELDPRLPDGIFCGPTYHSKAEVEERRAVFERARAQLEAACDKAIPGVDLARVRIIAIGVGNFIDAVSPQNNQMTTVYASLVGISNLHPSVAQSPLGVVLAGLWNPPAVLSAKKIAGQDTSMNASAKTRGHAAAVDAITQDRVVAAPMRKLLKRRPLIMRSSNFPGLWNIPEPYVAFVFYRSNIHADAPVMANLTGKVEHHDWMAGGHGDQLSVIPDTKEVPGVGPVFDLPRPYDGAVVAQHFHNACALPAGAPAQVASKAWLAENHFNAVVPPPVLYSWWKTTVPGGVSNFFDRLTYDVLHCYFIGLLSYFMDTVVIIICNSHRTMELGYRANGAFDERIGAMPAFEEGFRRYPRFAQGYGKRAINSGNDRFYLICTFIWAIGLDDQIIPDPGVRAVVLSACEAAAVLAHLLHAEALTPAARTATYWAARRFLKKLHLPAFLSRQTSNWNLIKFRMLLWIVNGLTDAAPTSTNSAKFEAALRLIVSRILARAASNQDCLRSVVKHYVLRAALDRLRSAGGPVAAALAAAAKVPARRRLLDRCDELRGGAALSIKVKDDPSDLYVAAIVADWASVPGNVGPAPGAAVDFGRATFFERAWLPRPDHRFAAHIDLGDVLVIDPLSARFGPQPAPAAAAGNILDDPARIKLARLRALFYLPPPAAGQPSDGLPVAAGGDNPDINRMFALVHPFAEQGPGDAARVKAMGLKFHAIRAPVAAQQQPGAAANAQRRLPLQVWPLREVCRALRVGPDVWPAFGPVAAAAGMTPLQLREEAAKCKKGPVLVFLPPTRGTFWPTGGPAEGLRAAEAAEEEEE